MTGDGIFINYRRSDTAPLAGRMHERMVQALPRRSVFLDVSTIPLGSDFEKTIETELKRANVMLVLIGADWLAVQEGDERPAIWNEDDYVRREILWALQHGQRVVPILVDDMKMPSDNELPPDIRALTKQNAAELRNSRFDDDFKYLVRAIDDGTSLYRRLRLISEGWRAQPTIIGSFGGLALLLVVLIAHKELTGVAIAARLGVLGSFLIVPISLIVGGYIGNRFAKRGRSRERQR